MTDVVFLVFQGVKLLDVSGPAEVFAEANNLGADYRMSYVSATGSPVSTSVGMTLDVAGPAGQAVPGGTVVIPGSDDLVSRPLDPGLVASATALAENSSRVVPICTGAFVLAAAGLLKGRRATTHWRHADVLARAFPDVQVQPDALFVQDQGVFTSAGVSAGMDLALALVERDHGPALARDAARNLVSAAAGRSVPVLDGAAAPARGPPCCARWSTTSSPTRPPSTPRPRSPGLAGSACGT